jgi:hypothetical protein
MDVVVISLQRVITGRMAIHAAGTCQDFCRLGKHSPRPRSTIRDTRKGCGFAYLSRRLLRRCKTERRAHQGGKNREKNRRTCPHGSLRSWQGKGGAVKLVRNCGGAREPPHRSPQSRAVSGSVIEPEVINRTELQRFPQAPRIPDALMARGATASTLSIGWWYRACLSNQLSPNGSIDP